jgi:glycosyltransferase involved in cell wall biosynthesis
MKIAIVTPSPTGPYGGERLVLNLCSELIKMNNDVTLFTPKYNHLCDDMLHPDLKIVETGHPNIKDWELSKFVEQYSIAKIYKYLTDEFDIINVHSYPTAITGALAKIINKVNVPIVYQCYEPPRLVYDLSEETYMRLNPLQKIVMILSGGVIKSIDRWSIKYMDEIITISRFIQDQTKKIYHRDSVFIMPGIETKNFNRDVRGDSIRKKYAADGDFIVLTCNKLHPRKRIDILIKAIPVVIKKYKKIKVIITGDGIEREKLQKLINELNVNKYVLLVGFITDRDLPKYYAACDVFVYTGIREPQGGSYAEALASGKPVIVPDDGGPVESIIEGKTGFVFKSLDSRDLAKKIIWCIENKHYLKQMSKVCRMWVEENRNWKKMARETFDVFKECLNEKRQKRI